MASIEPADVVVGVLQERRVHLHLPGQHGLELVGHVVPGRDLVVPPVSSASAGMTPSSFCRAKVRSRWASQPSSNCPAYLSIHSAATWCGACVAPGAK